jgi:hypothetical protein
MCFLVSDERAKGGARNELSPTIIADMRTA